MEKKKMFRDWICTRIAGKGQQVRNQRLVYRRAKLFPVGPLDSDAPSLQLCNLAAEPQKSKFIRLGGIKGLTS